MKMLGIMNPKNNNLHICAGDKNVSRLATKRSAHPRQKCHKNYIHSLYLRNRREDF